MATVTLDKDICFVVFLPLFVITILAAFLRMYISACTASDVTEDVEDAKMHQIALRTGYFRRNVSYLPKTSYHMRRLFFIDETNGFLVPPTTSTNLLDSMTRRNPGQNLGMIKNHAAFIAIQTGLGFLVNSVFSGFIVAKTPFPLTSRFRSITQRGITISNIDVSYVSSASWYIFNVFGTGGIISMLSYLFFDPTSLESKNLYNINATDPYIIKSPNAAGMNPLQAMMPKVGQQDPKKIYSNYRENIKLVTHQFKLNNVEGDLHKLWTQ